jgi:internalin A
LRVKLAEICAFAAFIGSSLNKKMMSELALQLIAENKAKHARGEDARVLDLGNCGLVEVPEEVGDCVWVEELIFGSYWQEFYLENKIWEIKKSQNNRGENNNITSLKPFFSHLTLLKKLVLNQIQINNLLMIEHLANLQILHGL